MDHKLTIGKVAAAAQVNVETIRFYQRRGLLTEPAKPKEGFRYYDDATVARVRFVKRAQALGFSLEEASVCWLWKSPGLAGQRTTRQLESCDLWRSGSPI